MAGMVESLERDHGYHSLIMGCIGEIPSSQSYKGTNWKMQTEMGK